jgi:hypothetical protein
VLPVELLRTTEKHVLLAVTWNTHTMALDMDLIHTEQFIGVTAKYPCFYVV